MTEQEYREIRPYIRSALAILFYLRFGQMQIDGTLLPVTAWHGIADAFLTEFEMFPGWRKK